MQTIVTSTTEVVRLGAAIAGPAERILGGFPIEWLPIPVIHGHAAEELRQPAARVKGGKEVAAAKSGLDRMDAAKVTPTNSPSGHEESKGATSSSSVLNGCGRREACLVEWKSAQRLRLKLFCNTFETFIVAAE